MKFSSIDLKYRCRLLVLTMMLGLTVTSLQAENLTNDWLKGATQAPGLPELLPANRAFVVTATALDRSRLEIVWHIAKATYLYRDKISIKLLSSTQPIHLDIDATSLDTLLPRGLKQWDAEFGHVEVYRDEVKLLIPLEVDMQPGLKQNPVHLLLELGYQGCADRGVCYPPVRQTVDIALPLNQSESAKTLQINTMAFLATRSLPDSFFLMTGGFLAFAAWSWRPSANSRLSNKIAEHMMLLAKTTGIMLFTYWMVLLSKAAAGIMKL